MLPTKTYQSPSKRAHSKDKNMLLDPLHCVCHSTWICFLWGKRNICSRFEPKACAPFQQLRWLFFCPLWSPRLYSSCLFLLTCISLKGCSFQKCCKAMNCFCNLTQLPWKEWSVWCLYTYVLKLTSVTWNIVFFIKITWSRSHSSSYAQISLVIIHVIGRENLQNWSQLWFKLFILV